MSVKKQITILESHKSKVDTMKTLGKWNRLIKKAQRRQAKNEKIKRLVILGKWRLFSTRIYRRNKNIPKWTKLIRGLYAQSGEFGLSYLNSFQTSTVINKINTRNEKLGKLEVLRRWAEMVRKLTYNKNRE